MTVDLWKIPSTLIPELKEAYENYNFIWMVKIWNQYEVTDRICASCPDSISKVKEHIPKLWTQS